MNINDMRSDMLGLMSELGMTLTAAMDAAGQCRAGALSVRWAVQSGGTLANQSTGALTGSVETVLSGTLPAIAVEENARTVLRTYTEIATGDLLVTLPPCPQITLYPGQSASGTVALASVSSNQPTFVWQGREYSQKELSKELQGLWTESVAGVALTEGILLRRST